MLKVKLCACVRSVTSVRSGEFGAAGGVQNVQAEDGRATLAAAPGLPGSVLGHGHGGREDRPNVGQVGWPWYYQRRRYVRSTWPASLAIVRRIFARRGDGADADDLAVVGLRPAAPIARRHVACAQVHLYPALLPGGGGIDLDGRDARRGIAVAYQANLERPAKASQVILGLEQLLGGRAAQLRQVDGVEGKGDRVPLGFHVPERLSPRAVPGVVAADPAAAGAGQALGGDGWPVAAPVFQSQVGGCRGALGEAHHHAAYLARLGPFQTPLPGIRLGVAPRLQCAVGAVGDLVRAQRVALAAAPPAGPGVGGQVDRLAGPGVGRGGALRWIRHMSLLSMMGCSTHERQHCTPCGLQGQRKQEEKGRTPGRQGHRERQGKARVSYSFTGVCYVAYNGSRRRCNLEMQRHWNSRTHHNEPWCPWCLGGSLFTRGARWRALGW